MATPANGANAIPSRSFSPRSGVGRPKPVATAEFESLQQVGPCRDMSHVHCACETTPQSDMRIRNGVRFTDLHVHSCLTNMAECSVSYLWRIHGRRVGRALTDQDRASLCRYLPGADRGRARAVHPDAVAKLVDVPDRIATGDEDRKPVPTTALIPTSSTDRGSSAAKRRW